MKRYFQIINVFFVFIFFLSVSPFNCQAAQNCELTYKVNKDGTITVTGCIADVDELIIPSEIDGYHVSKIGARAFGVTDSELYSNKECFCTVRSLIIEEGVSEIEYAAFMNCKNLRTISIPKTLITVRDRAFYGCDNLKCVTIPDNIELIAEESFGYTTNPVYNSIEFNDDTQSIPSEDFMILGWQNSEAETYAKENNFTFIALDKTSPIITDTTTSSATENTTTTTTTTSVTTTESVISEMTTTTTITEPKVFETTIDTTTIETTVTSTEATINLSSKSTTTTETTTVCTSPNPTTTMSENNNDIPQTGMPWARAAEGLAVVLTVGGAIVALKSRKK